ncbi:MAG: signal protein [Janthinobacterium lividum]
MKRFILATAALLAFAPVLPAQQTGTMPGTAPAAVPRTAPETTAHATPAARKQTSKAPMQQTPGGGPDQVWVNTNSSVYHCPSDRFYGKTSHGRYMTEAAAKSAGAKGVGGKTCFAGK